MVSALSLYVDDSGSRVPDKRGGHSSSPWFGLGGVLLWERDEDVGRELYARFRDTWKAQLATHIPLHSYDIRHKKGPFAWLKTEPTISGKFYSELTSLLVATPMYATGCVIDRAGYVARYFDKYDSQKRWLLCKTAFSVLLERTAKYASRLGTVVRVYV